VSEKFLNGILAQKDYLVPFMVYTIEVAEKGITEFLR